jgi:hypothetical protein
MKKEKKIHMLNLCEKLQIKYRFGIFSLLYLTKLKNITSFKLIFVKMCISESKAFSMIWKSTKQLSINQHRKKLKKPLEVILYTTCSKEILIKNT